MRVAVELKGKWGDSHDAPWDPYVPSVDYVIFVQRRLQREQEELARKQKEDLERERKPSDNTSAQDQVAEAWRKAQQEAAPRRGRHSGRHGSPSRGGSAGGGGAAPPPPQHTAVANLRESRSRSRSPGRDGGGGAHGLSDRGTGGLQGGQTRVGFAEPLDAGHERGFERGLSGHGGFHRGPGASQRPLSSRRPGPGGDQLGSCLLYTSPSPRD